jgi:hypothetical protein
MEQISFLLKLIEEKKIKKKKQGEEKTIRGKRTRRIRKVRT